MSLRECPHCGAVKIDRTLTHTNTYQTINVLGRSGGLYVEIEIRDEEIGTTRDTTEQFICSSCSYLYHATNLIELYDEMKNEVEND